MKTTQDISGPQWWLGEKNIHSQQKTEENIFEGKKHETNEEIKALLELAKSMHFATEIKKNIFVQLMSSHDYIQATKRLLDMKIKRLEDLANVLV